MNLFRTICHKSVNNINKERNNDNLLARACTNTHILNIACLET